MEYSDYDQLGGSPASRRTESAETLRTHSDLSWSRIGLPEGPETHAEGLSDGRHYLQVGGEMLRGGNTALVQRHFRFPRRGRTRAAGDSPAHSGCLQALSGG